MAAYNKAIAALLAAVLQMLVIFGIEPGEEIRQALEVSVPMLGAVLVYLVPNKAPAPE